MLEPGRCVAAALVVASLACAGGHPVDGPAPRSAPAPAPEGAPAAPADGRPLGSAASTVPGEYLVTLAPDAGEALIRERFGALGIDRVRALGRNVFLVRLQTDPGLAALERIRAEDGRIRAVQPNFVYRTSD
jgi:hypothetical protein